MNKQIKTIGNFISGANFHMIKFPSKPDEEFGKILNNEEINSVDVLHNEIYRSIGYKNFNTLFVLNLLSPHKILYVDNSIQLLINNLSEARVIEAIYPKIFKWCFDGISIKAYAIIPSGNIAGNAVITRYGGTKMFIHVLKQHLKNIGEMQKGHTPNYDFTSNYHDVDETELSIGSINTINNMYSVGITSKMSYIDIIRNSGKNIQTWKNLNVLDMKYWSKEINPDFITEAKHIKLKTTLKLDMSFKLFPQCIKNLMGLKHKGNFNRFLLSKFLLSIHTAKDAKFIYDSIMDIEEKKHIKYGNCNNQWNYILNNINKYSCPTCKNLLKFCSPDCKLAHPLELIQKSMEKNE